MSILPSLRRNTSSWARSRHWKSLLFFAVPLWLAMLLWAYSVPVQHERDEWIGLSLQRAIQIDISKTQCPNRDGSSCVCEKCRDKDLQIMRILQNVLDVYPKQRQAKYLLAKSLLGQGRVGATRRLMESIAPTSVRGYAPAHAWLALDHLNQVRSGQAMQAGMLEYHIRIALDSSISHEVFPRVLADIYCSRGDLKEAIAVMEGPAESDPYQWLEVAKFAVTQDIESCFERAKLNLERFCGRRIRRGTAKRRDYLSLSAVALLEEDGNTACEWAEKGLASDPQDGELRRALANGKLTEFKRQYNLNAEQADLSLLEAAIALDATNPHVDEFIARLVLNGVQLPDSTRENYEVNLSKGAVSPLTHILTSEMRNRQRRYQEAVQHLEVALRYAPQSWVVHNNLALALVRAHPDDQQVVTRAKELLSAAQQLNGSSVELLDTLGQVCLASDETFEAIRYFEQVLEMEPARGPTREKLIAAYRKANMVDLAMIHERELDQQRATEVAPANGG